ncbi:MAG: hypothetical protein ACRETX_02120 [Steroidobacteraceae bacterium]
MSRNLENLVQRKLLKAEPPDRAEFEGLLDSGRVRLRDALKESLAVESRFDLVYNAAHAIALAALRWHGYRSDKRYLVFQCLEHTLGCGPEIWRILAMAHERRNVAEYQGHLDVDEQLLKELLAATQLILDKVSALKEP